MINSSILTSHDLNTNTVDICKDISGVEGVIIYCGENPYSDVIRVKISNVEKLTNFNDLFTITLQDYTIYGEVKITNIDEVLSFLRLNHDSIVKYSTNAEFSTYDFLNSLINIYNK